MSERPEETLPRRFLRPLLLLSLARQRRSYGYELAEAVRALGLSVELAGVYRDLRAMEQHDLVDSTWEPSPSGPDRRVYELTAAGERAATEAGIELASTARLLVSALARLELPTGVGR